MKASKFTDAQKAFIIKQAEDGTSIAETAKSLIRKAIAPRSEHQFLRSQHVVFP